MRMGFQGYQVGKGILVFYIHLVVNSVRNFFPIGEEVSLRDGGLLGVSFLLGCWAFFLGVHWPYAPSKGMLTSIMGTILGSSTPCKTYK